MNDEVIEVLLGHTKPNTENSCLPHAIEQGVTDCKDIEEAVLKEELFGRTPTKNALQQDADHFEDKDETVTQESLCGSNQKKESTAKEELLLKAQQ